MKVELELPDWVDERNIHVFRSEKGDIWINAGIEPVAYKLKNAPWMIKTSRCSRCGLCCKQLPRSHPFRMSDNECYYLEKEPGNNNLWRCGLKIMRPHGCAIFTPSNIPECTVRYEEVK